MIRQMQIFINIVLYDFLHYKILLIQLLEKKSHPILFSSKIQGMWQTCVSGERYKARHQKVVSIKGSRDFRQ